MDIPELCGLDCVDGGDPVKGIGDIFAANGGYRPLPALCIWVLFGDCRRRRALFRPRGLPCFVPCAALKGWGTCVLNTCTTTTVVAMDGPSIEPFWERSGDAALPPFPHASRLQPPPVGCTLVGIRDTPELRKAMSGPASHGLFGVAEVAGFAVRGLSDWEENRRQHTWDGFCRVLSD